MKKYCDGDVSNSLTISWFNDFRNKLGIVESIEQTKEYVDKCPSAKWIIGETYNYQCALCRNTGNFRDIVHDAS
jgi:hypothetical protein